VDDLEVPFRRRKVGRAEDGSGLGARVEYEYEYEYEYEPESGHASMTSTFARGTMTLMSPRSTSTTRTRVSVGSAARWTGSADTVPRRPKYGARMQRTAAPTARPRARGWSGAASIADTITSGRITPARI